MDSISAKTRENMRNLMQISVDGSDFVEIGLEHLVGKDGTNQLSGQEIADELTNVIQERFGDGKKFDVSAYYKSGAAVARGPWILLETMVNPTKVSSSTRGRHHRGSDPTEGHRFNRGCGDADGHAGRIGHGDEQVLCWRLCLGDSRPWRHPLAPTPAF